jgi:NADP-dependent 3-hydroxy acid dehydrogenase YdfG
MSTNIEGKVVVITGQAAALDAKRYLARPGAAVVLGAQRKDRSDALTAEIVATEGDCEAGTRA